MKDQRRSFRAYDEVHASRAKVLRAADEAELRRVLRSLSTTPRRRLTVRGGGYSLDEQALGDDTALELAPEGFGAVGEVEVRRGRATITAGAMATWGEVLEAASREGWVPPNTVTGRDITVGGTLSSDCLSRFSGAWGKEAESVERFRIMLADGRVVTACADAPAGSLERRVFDGAIGGLGGLGVVLDATYSLRRVSTPGRRPRVRTYFDPVGWRGFGWREFLGQLRYETLHARRAVRRLGAKAWRAPLPQGIYDAVSATVWFRRMGPRGLIISSRHVTRGALQPSAIYSGPDRLRLFAERTMTERVAADVGQTLFKTRHTFQEWSVDELEPFVFFMQGNVEAHHAARDCGWRMTSSQQTFVLPEREAEGFCEEVEAATSALHPTVLDLLYLPADRGGFLLSPTRGIDGFAVTLAYQTRDGARQPEVQKLLRSLASRCGALGGRVSLVKNVYVADRTLRAMYSEGLEEFRALKAELDPKGLFSSRMLERLLGSGADRRGGGGRLDHGASSSRGGRGAIGNRGGEGMEVTEIVEWLGAVGHFNDFELEPGDAGTVADLLGVGDLDAHLYPLGFHGSGSWVALWRRDPSTPWGDAPWVWIDSEGSPWEVFASSAEEGLAALSLYTGTLYDALSAATRTIDDSGAEAEAREQWRTRTPKALADAATRYEGQREHRARLARAGIALPTNAYATALDALRRHGRFSQWLTERSAPDTAPSRGDSTP